MAEKFAGNRKPKRIARASERPPAHQKRLSRRDATQPKSVKLTQRGTRGPVVPGLDMAQLVKDFELDPGLVGEQGGAPHVGDLPNAAEITGFFRIQRETPNAAWNPNEAVAIFKTNGALTGDDEKHLKETTEFKRPGPKTRHTPLAVESVDPLSRTTSSRLLLPLLGIIAAGATLVLNLSPPETLTKQQEKPKPAKVQATSPPKEQPSPKQWLQSELEKGKAEGWLSASLRTAHSRELALGPARAESDPEKRFVMFLHLLDIEMKDSGLLNKRQTIPLMKRMYVPAINTAMQLAESSGNPQIVPQARQFLVRIGKYLHTTREEIEEIDNKRVKNGNNPRLGKKDKRWLVRLESRIKAFLEKLTRTEQMPGSPSKDGSLPQTSSSEGN